MPADFYPGLPIAQPGRGSVSLQVGRAEFALGDGVQRWRDQGRAHKQGQTLHCLVTACCVQFVIAVLSARDPRDPPDGETNWRAIVLFILRNIKQTVLTTLALYFSALTTPVLAQAAIIDAIMGGGGVVGTECVNGVVSPEYQADDAITEFGPGTTLFVKDAGKTRLRKGSGNWNDGVGYINDDKVVFSLIDGNNTNQRHYLVDGTDQNGLIAEFGDASGGTPSVPDGQGEYTMEFVPATGNSGGIQVLGTIYRATLEDSKWTCVQPGLVAPETPVIQSANPQNNGATLVLSPDADQVIEQYTVQLSKPGTSTEFEVPIAGGGTGTLTVEERSSERTVLSFVGSGITNGQTWTVKVKAENGNGANVSDFSNSVEFISGAMQCNQVSDWTAAANDADWSCIVDDKEYAYADFHILTTDGNRCLCRAQYLFADG